MLLKFHHGVTPSLTLKPLPSPCWHLPGWHPDLEVQPQQPPRQGLDRSRRKKHLGRTFQRLWGQRQGRAEGRGRPWCTEGQGLEGRAGFPHQKAALQAEPNCTEALAACQRCRKPAEVQIMLICTHTGASGALEAGQGEREAGGKDEEEEEQGEDLHTKMLGLCVWGGSISKARIQMIPTKPKLS